ncbi:MAG: hypothetical protein AAGA90_24215 [Actinomycetota bacterium]
MEAFAPFVPFVAGYLSTSRRSLTIALVVGVVASALLAVVLPTTSRLDRDWTLPEQATFFAVLVCWWALGMGIGAGMRWVISALQRRPAERD